MTAKTDNMIESTAKTIEQAGAATGFTISGMAFLIEHQREILVFCAVGSFLVGFIGMLISWYYKQKHYNLAKHQARRDTDKLYEPSPDLPDGLPEPPNKR